MENTAVAPAPKFASALAPKPAKKSNITTFEEHLLVQYGPAGSLRRMEFDAKSNAFLLCVQLQNLRTAAGLTQQQLADRIGVKRAFITRIENGNIDVQLSTYLRFLEGLGFSLEISPTPILQKPVDQLADEKLATSI